MHFTPRPTTFRYNELRSRSHMQHAPPESTLDGERRPARGVRPAVLPLQQLQLLLGEVGAQRVPLHRRHGREGGRRSGTAAAVSAERPTCESLSSRFGFFSTFHIIIAMVVVVFCSVDDRELIDCCRNRGGGR